MEKLRFKAPNIAPAHLALRQAASAAGFDDEALRDLLWLLNAHDKLTAHGQIFCNLAEMLRSEVFSDGSLDWAEAWKAQVPTWIELCNWIWRNCATLEKQLGLHDLQKGKGSRGHPILGEGAVRHAIPAALWSIHCDVGSYPPPDEASTSAAQAYFHLQAHLFAAYAECRFRIGDRAFWEDYSGERERPVAPTRTSGVSPGVREMSTGDFDELLLALPAASNTRQFALELSSANLEKLIERLPAPETRRQGRIYVTALKRYFSRYLRMLGGWVPPQSLRRGWGGGGGTVRRHGFVQFLGAPGVYLQDEVISTDPDLPEFTGQQVFMDTDEEYEDDPNEVERSGLAPGETLEHVFRLFDPKASNGRFLELMRQWQAIESRAQFLTFANEILTPEEVHGLWQTADQYINRYLDSPSASNDWHQHAVVGLLVKLSLCFGQPIDTLLSLRIIWLEPGKPVHGLTDIDTGRALIITSSAPGVWTNAQLVGIRLPGIMPRYRTTLPDELEEIDGAYVDSFLLPDLLGVANQLLRCLSKRSPPADRVFGIQLDTVKNLFSKNYGRLPKYLLKRDKVTRDRITLDKLPLQLGRLVTGMTGDQSLAWVLTADEKKSDEPRMHYTRHEVRKIQATYRRAAHRIARMAGVRIDDTPRPDIEPVEPTAAVGARFVIATDEFRRIVETLTGYLTDPSPDRKDADACAAYHHHYLLYMELFQSVETSLRAITAPDELFQTWLRQRHQHGWLVSSLSDKTGPTGDKIRLAQISPELAHQYEHYAVHLDTVIDSIRLPRRVVEACLNRTGCFFTLDTTSVPDLLPAKPGWMAAMLQQVSGYPIPANFTRAFLRTELLRRDCPAQIVDALMGHQNLGESPYATYSTFDYLAYQETIRPYLVDIRNSLGFRPIASRLVPFRDRPRKFA
jgi:hypothetical protein